MSFWNWCVFFFLGEAEKEKKYSQTYGIAHFNAKLHTVLLLLFAG